MTRPAVVDHHIITVTTRQDNIREAREIQSITFTCAAPADAECRTYPADCGCERFTSNEAKTHDLEGHAITAGNRCWLTDWFQNEGAIYTGDDLDDMRDDCTPAIDRTGTIRTTWQDEWVEWDWTSTPALAEATEAPLGAAPLHAGDESCQTCYGEKTATVGETLPDIVCYRSDAVPLAIFIEGAARG